MSRLHFPLEICMEASDVGSFVGVGTLVKTTGVRHWSGGRIISYQIL